MSQPLFLFVANWQPNIGAEIAPCGSPPQLSVAALQVRMKRWPFTG